MLDTSQYDLIFSRINMQTLSGNKERGQWDLGTSCVIYIPMLDTCPWDLGTSLENCIPTLDVCPWDLGKSLENCIPMLDVCP